MVRHRRRDFHDEWSFDQGETWVEAPLRRALFQYYITVLSERINLWRRQFAWWTVIEEDDE